MPDPEHRPYIVFFPPRLIYAIKALKNMPLFTASIDEATGETLARLRQERSKQDVRCYSENQQALKFILDK